MYEQVIKDLRVTYDRNAVERDKYEVSEFKITERDHFLSTLQQENKKKLLEIGAGTGQYGKFFNDNGMVVICTDLSPENVRRCQEKGLTAYEMDFLSLDFPSDSFEAVFALNCLLHVPKEDMSRVLNVISIILKSGGLFYLGLYGGKEFQGIWSQDKLEPKRFFSFYTDDQIRQISAEFFDIIYFKRINLEGEGDIHFQSIMLRNNQVNTGNTGMEDETEKSQIL